MTLDGIVKEKRGQYGRAGTYRKASGLINSKFHWSKIDGDRSIWYNNISNYWAIAPSSYLGSDNSGFRTIREEECPTSKNRYKYSNGTVGAVPLAPIDEFTIQCT